MAKILRINRPEHRPTERQRVLFIVYGEGMEREGVYRRGAYWQGKEAFTDDVLGWRPAPRIGFWQWIRSLLPWG